MRRAERVVLFDTWHGRYGDSPRAISAALHEDRPDVRQVWTLTDPSVAPPWVTSVAPRSARHGFYLLRADVLVANNSMPLYPKRPGARYLQTWHGTPLKRIAFDIENPHFRGSSRYLRQFARDVARWDLLLSPNRHSTEIFRRAFRYGGEVAEVGYPRNDVLVHADANQRAAVRQRLRIAADRRAVLYAPTWRDDVSDESAGALRAALTAWVEGMPPDDLLLVRGHQHDRVLASIEDVAGRLINVSDHPDIQELYLAADLLVTDYSSTMFDFAVTRRPMVFFTYDLDEYRDELRGFYVDFEGEAPGPLVRDVPALLAALRAPDLAQQHTSPAYQAFVRTYCPHEDGGATARALEAVADWL